MKKFLSILLILPILTLSAFEPEAGAYADFQLIPMASEHLEVIDDQNFDSKISTGYAIVDFYADWCGPCRAFAPKFAKLADEMHHLLSFYKVNTDNAPKTTAKMGVKAIPTIVLFKDGHQVDLIRGNVSEETLRNFIESGLSK